MIPFINIVVAMMMTLLTFTLLFSSFLNFDLFTSYFLYCCIFSMLYVFLLINFLNIIFYIIYINWWCNLLLLHIFFCLSETHTIILVKVQVEKVEIWSREKRKMFDFFIVRAILFFLWLLANLNPIFFFTFFSCLSLTHVLSLFWRKRKVIFTIISYVFHLFLIVSGKFFFVWATNKQPFFFIHITSSHTWEYS